MRQLLVGSFAAAFLLLAGSAIIAGKLSVKARFCDDLENDVIIAGKLDMASKYLTDDFREHNPRLTASGLPDFLEKLQAMRGALRERTVLSEGDLVVFMSANPERSDPAIPGKKFPASTHFDVYKLRGGKTSEHRD